MAELSEKEKHRRIKWVLLCINSNITEKGFGVCAERGCGEYRVLCRKTREAITEHYHLSNDLEEIC